MCRRREVASCWAKWKDVASWVRVCAGNNCVAKQKLPAWKRAGVRVSEGFVRGGVLWHQNQTKKGYKEDALWLKVCSKAEAAMTSATNSGSNYNDNEKAREKATATHRRMQSMLATFAAPCRQTGRHEVMRQCRRRCRAGAHCQPITVFEHAALLGHIHRICWCCYYPCNRQLGLSHANDKLPSLALASPVAVAGVPSVASGACVCVAMLERCKAWRGVLDSRHELYNHCAAVF